MKLGVLKFANDKKKAWLILLIDFNKAFDSISHDFLTKPKLPNITDLT